MQVYFGSCHCGAVSYQVEMELTNAVQCNCSHCFLKGFLLAFVPEPQVKILNGAELLTEYRFNKMHIAHLFCKICGSQTFGRATNAEGEPVYAINLRTVKDVNLETLEVIQYDGKSI